MDNTEINLVVPALLPCNGRIVLQAVNKKEYKHGNIIIPVNHEIWTQERKPDRQRTQEDNPYKNYDFYVVAYAPEVNEQMRLPAVTPIEIGDKIIMSERFEPILYQEGPETLYFLIHWQDTLGVIKQTSKKLPPSNIDIS
jgi:co-chaperonin GroES (HSP10)